MAGGERGQPEDRPQLSSSISFLQLRNIAMLKWREYQEVYCTHSGYKSQNKKESFIL